MTFGRGDMRRFRPVFPLRSKFSSLEDGGTGKFPADYMFTGGCPFSCPKNWGTSKVKMNTKVKPARQIRREHCRRATEAQEIGRMETRLPAALTCDRSGQAETQFQSGCCPSCAFHAHSVIFMPLKTAVNEESSGEQA